MENNEVIDRERAALKTIQDINSGLIDPNLLDKETRRECVAVLVGEGYTNPQIAQIMKRSEKTISRDMVDIRKKNALSPSVEFARETIGDLITKARIHASYLMRIAREKDSPASSRAGSEYLAWKVIKELVEKLQTLGYLPLKPQEITGELYHRIAVEEGGESLDDVKKMLSEIESVSKEAGTYTSELGEELELLSGRIEQSEVVLDAKKLKKEQEDQITKKETQDEKM